MNRSLHSLLIAGVALLTTQTGARAQDQIAPAANAEAERTYPSLPGAVRKPPEWVVKDAPFDVAQFFDAPAADENAAPLYLEALFEFVPVDMKNCVSPEMRQAHEGFFNERALRTGKLQIAKEEEVTADERAAILVEYRDSFAKLARAQQRQRCVFETGIDYDAPLPHAQSARQVLRLLDWQVEAHVAENRLDAAIDDIAMALRLCRDLRPRGPAISQLVSFALDAVVTSSLLPKVLASPELTLKQCDRLLDLLNRHSSDRVDPFSEALRAEYIMYRDLLYHLERMEKVEALGDLPESIRETTSEMTADDYAAEINRLNRWVGPLIEAKAPSGRELRLLAEKQQGALKETKLTHGFMNWVSQFAESCRRDRTRLGATRCLVALRHWQLKSKNANPPDLHVLCKDVGMPGVPIDEYSSMGDLLRWTLITGEFVIYSVAGDGKDDHGRADWQFGQQPGDWIFRLPAVHP